MKKRVLFILLVIMGVFSLVSCAGGGIASDSFTISATSNEYLLEKKSDNSYKLTFSVDESSNLKKYSKNNVVYYIDGDNACEAVMVNDSFTANKEGKVKVSAKIDDLVSKNSIEIGVKYSQSYIAKNEEDIASKLEEVSAETIDFGGVVDIGISAEFADKYHLIGCDDIMFINEKGKLEVCGVMLSTEVTLHSDVTGKDIWTGRLSSTFGTIVSTLIKKELISEGMIFQYETTITKNKIANVKKLNLNGLIVNDFFLGFNKYSEQLMCNIISNYQMINDKLHLFICDDDSKNFIDQFNGKYFVNKHINDIINDSEEKNEYFDLEPSRFELNSISYEKNSYELKTQLLASKGNYNLYYIDYDNDKINFEKAIELDDFLKSFQVENYKIYVRFSINNQFNIKELNNRSISIYGDNESILSKRIIIDQSLDLLAKNVNYFYSKMYGNDSNELTIDELWDKLTLIDKNSNRSAAMNIIPKLNLLGLTLSKDSNIKGISDDEYFKIYADSNLNRSLDMDDYKFDNARLNLAILEHYRWNNFQMFNNIHPMKKKLIFKDDKYNRRNKELKLHSNILSFKGLLELENYLANWDKLTQDEKTNYSQIFIKDFDLMDNLPSVIEKTGIKIIRL